MNRDSIAAYPDVAVVLTLHHNMVLTPVMYQKCLYGLREQTYPPLVVAVDDCSERATIEKFQATSMPYSVLVSHRENMGFTVSLIESIHLIRRKYKCSYIAIHDADDYSSVHRIQKQRRFLIDNPHIAVVGSYAYVADKNDQNHRLRQVPKTHDEIAKFAYNRNPMMHGTVMIRSSLFDKVGYDKDHTYSQDYGLWTKALLNGFQFANLDEPLVTRCQHRQSITGHVRHRRVQKKIFYSIRTKYRKHYGG